MKRHQSLKKNGRCNRSGFLTAQKKKKDHKQERTKTIKRYRQSIRPNTDEALQKLGTKNPQGKPISADAKNVILCQYDSYIQNGYSPIEVRNIL